MRGHATAYRGRDDLDEVLPVDASSAGGRGECGDQEKSEERSAIHGTKLRNQAILGNENLRAGPVQHGERHVVWEGACLFVSLAEGVGPGQHPVGVSEGKGANPIELRSCHVHERRAPSGTMRIVRAA